MASEEWIASAARVDKPTTGSGFDSSFQHVLAMARADEEREALDRVMAARTVQRVGHENAGELLAMLGLDAVPTPKRRTKPARHNGAVAEKECPVCGQTKPAAEFVRRPRHRDGLETYCRACGRERKNEWAARRRARTGALS